jgi:capsular exopolysaccharide synthesis family protein
VNEIFDPAALLRTIAAARTAAQAPAQPADRARVARGPGGDVDIEFPLSKLASDGAPDLEVKAEASVRNSAVAAALGEPVVAEEFRLLRAKVRALDAERRFRQFGIVSAAMGEGKSTIAIGLARAFAQEPDVRVLLVEADLRRPTLETYLGVAKVPGLGEWLETGVGPIGLRRIGSGGFYMLSGGLPTHPRPPELLGSERMARMLESAQRSFDFVIVDCPPLVPVADAVMLQDLLDGFLLLVRERFTPVATITRALSRLKPDRIRGVVLNDHQEIVPRDGGYGAYGGYGSYFGKHE